MRIGTRVMTPLGAASVIASEGDTVLVLMCHPDPGPHIGHVATYTHESLRVLMLEVAS